MSHINTSIPGESPDDPNQMNEDSVGRTHSEVRKASTVSSHLRKALQPCGKHEIGEQLNCLASETWSKGPKKQKLLGLKCVLEEISAIDCVSGRATGVLELKKLSCSTQVSSTMLQMRKGLEMLNRLGDTLKASSARKIKSRMRGPRKTEM